MGLINTINKSFRPITTHSQLETTPTGSQDVIQTLQSDCEKNAAAVKTISKPIHHDVESGVARVEAVQAVWGKHGFWIVAVGIGMMMMMYELDNTTSYVYRNYALSSFNQLSIGAALSTSGVILWAVIKIPIAKLSNIIGRGETYCITVTCYVISYILFATAKSFAAFSGGYIFYIIGQSGTNIMNDIIISDITTARWRGIALAGSFFPFLFMPWISAFIVESVVSPSGIGWQWGVGMLGILFPFSASFIIVTLLYYQHKAKKLGLLIAPKERMTILEFCSQIDLGGTVLFCLGFGLLLVPMTLAASAPQGWSTPYIATMIALGGILLIILPFYETKFARHPIVPLSYFKNRSIIFAALLLASDNLGFAVTHQYLYPWSTIARGMSPRDATFLQYTNGVMEIFSAIVGGIIMLKTRRYKWLIFAAVTIRFLGYGLMTRLRGSSNPSSELFIVQLIQGFGSGIVLICALISAQIQVPHSQLAQITALVLCCAFLGSSVGASISGGIYTNTLKEELGKQLGEGADASLIEGLYNSITRKVPVWGSEEREAINEVYSNVLRYMTFTALGMSVPGFFLAFFLPNLELPDQKNLVET